MGKDKGVVHVVGTGTIGEPLIGLLCSFKDQAGFSEVTFHKRSPLPRDLPKLKALIARGAKLCVDEDKISDFEALGLKPTMIHEEALAKASAGSTCILSWVATMTISAIRGRSAIPRQSVKTASAVSAMAPRTPPEA